MFAQKYPEKVLLLQEKLVHTSVSGLNVLPQFEHGCKFAGVCASLKAKVYKYNMKHIDI